MTRFRSILFVNLAIACGALIGCEPSVTAPSGTLQSSASRNAGEGSETSAAAHLDLVAARGTLLATDKAYAAAGALTNLVDAIVAPLAPDVIFLAPGPGFLIGPDAVRAALNANPANPLSKWRWWPIRVDVSSDGNSGYTYGYTELELPNGTVLPGKYTAFWTRQPNGKWMMSVYRRLARPAGAVSLTPPPGFETPTVAHRRYFPNTDPTTELTGLFAVDVSFSDLAQANVSTAFETFAAPDAAQNGGGSSAPWVFGPSAIGALFPEAPAGFSWVPQLGRVAASGDLGVTVGYVYSGSTIISKYMTTWQRQATGEWLYVVD
jgi:ketosteroid isomerase-like protein